MEAHGKNPKQFVVAIIPARYKSTRLEGKLLLPLADKPLILHTLDQVKMASNVSRVLVATDDTRIFDVVNEYGGEALMTRSDHASGSDRIAEVAETLDAGTIVVNVQGDEPDIPVSTIEKAVDEMIADSSVDVVTTCERVTNCADVLSPDVVKVVFDSSGNALYFSRSAIPYPRDEVSKFGGLEAALEGKPELLSLYRKHTGLYVYRREFLIGYTQSERTPLENAESLEQLRVLEHGSPIRVVEVKESSVGVDTREDYERVRAIFED